MIRRRLGAASGLLTLLIGLLFPLSAHAASNTNLIDDRIFDSTGTMNAAQIDSFLNTFSGSCISTNSGFSAPKPTGYSPSTAYTYGSPESAGQVIYDASQAYELNPQVLLTKLQNEEGLVRGDGPYGCGALPMSAAVGYACTDSDTASHTYNYTNGTDSGTLSTPLYYRNGSPVNTVTNTCVNSASKAGFTEQLIRAAWLLKFGRMRSEGNTGWAIIKTNWDNSDDLSTCYGGPMTQGSFKRCPSDSAATYYDGYTTINGQSIHMDTGATAALYWYTPHLQSFTTIFQSFFGSPYAFIYKGTSYSAVFDPVYYLNNNPDVQQATGGDQLAAFDHFINYGMSEGRQASADFNVTTYRNRYPDLRWVFGTNLPSYYIHYITNGRSEGRTATGTAALQPVTSYGGIDYSNVYDFPTYITNNSDLNSKYSDDDTGALWHFINYGMNEGRRASANFSVQSYQARYYDLRRVFNNNLRSYYLHYITNGKAEGRIATGNYIGGTTVLNSIDYSAVYNLNDYENYNSDIKNTFGLNDVTALQHFVNYGMNEGRQASSTFNVYTYKARYPDLQAAFGNNLKAYYIHFINYGRAEGRSGI